MDCGLFGVRFLFLGMKKERCSMDELFIYFATPPAGCRQLPFCELAIWGHLALQAVPSRQVL